MVKYLMFERVWPFTSSVSVHAEGRSNDSEFYPRTQNVSMPSNLHNWWVHSEFQEGGVNKGVKRFLGREVSLSWSFHC